MPSPTGLSLLYEVPLTVTENRVVLCLASASCAAVDRCLSVNYDPSFSYTMHDLAVRFDVGNENGFPPHRHAFTALKRSTEIRGANPSLLDKPTPERENGTGHDGTILLGISPFSTGWRSREQHHLRAVVP